MAPEDLEALAAIEKLINKKLDRVLVPGFANAGTVATMVSAGAGEHSRGRQGSRRPERRPEPQHKPQHAKSQHAAAPHSTPQHSNPPPRTTQKSSDPIFSKPYEPGVAPIAVKVREEPSHAKRRERPVASLLGGLKRA